MSTANYSDLRKIQRVNLADAVPLQMPFAMYIESTNICNFKCTFCPESLPDYKEITGGFNVMDLAKVEDICQQIKAMGKLKTLNFYMMGEPFSNKHMPAYIATAKKYEIADKIIITSNGSLIKPEVAEKIIDSQLDYLRVSIYAATQERMERVTGTHFKLSKIVENVATLKRLRDERQSSKPHIYVKMIDSQDPGENEIFLNLFRPIADEVNIEPVMNWKEADDVQFSNLPISDMLKTDYFSNKKNVCPFPFYTLVVHADLKVSVCCVDWDKKTVVGDLSKQTLEEIWRGQELYDFQMTHLRHERHTLEACKSCTYLHTAPDNIDTLTADAFSSRVTYLPQV